MAEEINWKLLKQSLSKEDLQRFTGLSKSIKVLKEALELLREWKPLLCELSGRETCEKHYIKGCYTCGLNLKEGHIDTLIKRTSKQLAVRRYFLWQIVYDNGFAERPKVAPKVVPMERLKDVTDYGKRWDTGFWDSTAANFRTSPKRARDVRDNLAFVQQYLKDKFPEEG